MARYRYELRKRFRITSRHRLKAALAFAVVVGVGAIFASLIYGPAPKTEAAAPTDFATCGSVQSFTAPADGAYKLETWGAQGFTPDDFGTTVTDPEYDARGGYATGTVNLTAGQTIYVYVGCQGTNPTGGWNGGGDSLDGIYPDGDSGAGGGATDIRLSGGNWNDGSSLASRILVAGGGGGGWTNPRYNFSRENTAGTDTEWSGNQDSPGLVSGAGDLCDAPGFGYGVSCNTDAGYDQSGGGGGWFGGGTIGQEYAGGGSNYVFTSTSDKSGYGGNIPNSQYYLTGDSTIAGDLEMTMPDGSLSDVGHPGDGYARITPILTCGGGLECFKFTIDTRLTSTGTTTGTATAFSIPTSGFVGGASAHSYNWIVNWGDTSNLSSVGCAPVLASPGPGQQYACGTSATTSAGISHNYATAGQYQITIQPSATAANGWMNAFGFYSGAVGANVLTNKYMFRSIDSPLTNLMRTAGATNRFAYMFHSCFNGVGITSGFFANISTTGATNTSNMFNNTFYGFAYYSTTGIIPSGLFDSIDTAASTNTSGMFANTFSSYANYSTTGTIPAGLFSTISTSAATNTSNMFNTTFANFANSSTTATIPAGLFDAVSTAAATDMTSMFQSTFNSYATNSIGATIPAGLFSAVAIRAGSTTTNMFSNTFTIYAARVARFSVGGTIVNTSSTFAAPYATKNTSTDNTPATNPVVSAGNVVVPTYNSTVRSVAAPTGTYANYAWYSKDGTSCAVASPTADCGAQNATTAVTFPATPWTPTTSTEIGTVTFYGVRPLSQTNYRIYNNANSTTPGAARAGDNTRAVVGQPSTVGTDFRIRTGILNRSSVSMTVGETFTLQFGAKPTAPGATCADTTSWANVGTSSSIAYKINGATSGTVITNTPAPAAPSGATWIAQRYLHAAANFTVATAITANNAGLWDFSLTNLSAPPNTAYCFRIVNSGGVELNRYDQYPEIITSQDQYIGIQSNAPSGTVAIAVSPGTMSSNSDPLAVSTNAANGYNMTLAIDPDASGNALTHTINATKVIAALPGTATPTAPAALSGGTSRWGFRIGGFGNFGATTTQETNTTTSAYSWAAVPVNPLAVRQNALATDQTATGGANAPDSFNVWYGAAASAVQAPGTYQTEVIYTVATNP